MNVLEQCHESKFETRTWYFEQLAMLDLQYSHYITELLQCKVSIKSKLEQEYKQRLNNIDEKIKRLTKNNEKRYDHDDTSSMKDDLNSLIEVDNVNTQLLDTRLADNQQHNTCAADNQPVLTTIDEDPVGILYRVCDDLAIANDQSSANKPIKLVLPQGTEPESKREKRAKMEGKKENEFIIKPKCLDGARVGGDENKSRNRSSEYCKYFSKNGKTEYKCNICNKVCKSSSAARYHYIATHTTRYQCNFNDCNKCFESHGRLTAHERTHTNEKPFTCQFCQQSFGTKGNLTRHIRVHTGEKPYQCRYCDKRFNTSSNRKVHETIHTGEKPYKCQHCERRFRLLHHRTSHEKVHK